MARVAINPDVVEWARNWNSLSTEQLVQKLAVEPDVYKAWIEGGQRPTFKQAQKLAKKLNVPLTYLFLQEPPIIEVPVPDLRTVRNAARGSFSPNFIDVLYDSLRKRDWYRSLLLSQGQEPLDFIGKFQVTDDPRAVAADMRRVLASNSLFDSARSWEDYLL